MLTGFIVLVCAMQASAFGPPSTLNKNSSSWNQLSYHLFDANGSATIGWRMSASKCTYQGPPGIKWNISSFEGSVSPLASPAIGADGTVFINTIESLYAVDGQTGKLKWSFGTGGVQSPASPAIAIDGTIYVIIDIGGINGYLFAIDGQSGRLKWKYLLNCTNTICGSLSPAIGSDGTVYICAGSLYAFDGQSGILKYYRSECSGCDASPIVGADGTVYVFTNPNSSMALVCALQGQTGQVRWVTYVGCYVALSSLALGDGIVIMGCSVILALDMKSGRTRWMTGALVWAYSSAAIGLDGTVFIGGEYIYALDGQTGVLRWKFATGASSWNVPAIGADGTVYVGGKNTALALDGQTGSLYGMIPLNGPPTSAAIGIDGTIYFGVGTGLVAINCA